MTDYPAESVFNIMLTYIIPVLIITLLIIIYGILNVEKDEESSADKNPGCGSCSEKDSCVSSGHDNHVHFEIHKPDMNPAEGLFRKKKDK